MMAIKKYELSSLLIAFSFFQFGILQILAIPLNNQNIIAASTLAIVVLLLILYQLQIKKYVFLFFFIISLVFFSHYYFFHGFGVMEIYVQFLFKSFSLFLVGSFPFATEHLKKYMYIFSNLNFVVLTLIVLFGLVDQIEYMRFGYGMLPSLLIAIYFMRQKHKLFNFFITISSFSMIFIWGSRGPLIGLIIFLFIMIIYDRNIKLSKKVIFVTLVTISFIYLFFFKGFEKILNFLYFDLRLQTYSIAKLRMMLKDGLEASSSGRDQIYEMFLRHIEEHLLFGSGIGITHTLWDLTPHNLFLQLLLEFGIVGGFMILFIFSWLIYRLFSIRKFDNELCLLLSIIFAVSFGRLLVSSDLWLRQELWLFISLTINSHFIKKSEIERNFRWGMGCAHAKRKRAILSTLFQKDV